MIGFHLHTSVSGAWMPRVGRAGDSFSAAENDAISETSELTEY